MQDVAEAAQVSLGTVSRVINNNSTVTKPIRQRVLKAAKALGFVPDALARSMRTKATSAIGCLVPDIANPLYAEIVGAAERILHASSYNLVLASSGFRHDVELEILELFKSRRLDGLIAAVTREKSSETAAAIQSMSLPVVSIERDLPFAIGSVVTDHRGGLQQATQYLINLGHTRIGLITATKEILTGRQRSAGFGDAHCAAGLKVDRKLLAFGTFTHAETYGYAYKMLMSRSPPTALIAGVHEMVGVLKAARVMGLSIPQDLSLIAIGDTPVWDLFSPALTAVRWDTSRVGLVAAQLLLAELGDPQGKSDPKQLLLPTELLVRQSCAAPRLKPKI